MLSDRTRILSIHPLITYNMLAPGVIKSEVDCRSLACMHAVSHSTHLSINIDSRSHHILHFFNRELLAVSCHETLQLVLEGQQQMSGDEHKSEY